MPPLWVGPTLGAGTPVVLAALYRRQSRQSQREMPCITRSSSSSADEMVSKAQHLYGTQSRGFQHRRVWAHRQSMLCIKDRSIRAQKRMGLPLHLDLQTCSSESWKP